MIASAIVGEGEDEIAGMAEEGVQETARYAGPCTLLPAYCSEGRPTYVLLHCFICRAVALLNCCIIIVALIIRSVKIHGTQFAIFVTFREAIFSSSAQ